MIRAPSLHRDFTDAGETSMWSIEHLPAAQEAGRVFQLGTTDPDDPKVGMMVGRLGMGNNKKMPKSSHLLIAQLAFANSDLAFQGNHFVPGKFLCSVSIYATSLQVRRRRRC